MLQKETLTTPDLVNTLIGEHKYVSDHAITSLVNKRDINNKSYDEITYTNHNTMATSIGQMLVRT